MTTDPVYCEWCGRELPKGQTVTCANCERPACPEDATQCPHCGTWYCPDCDSQYVAECDECGREYCDQCRNQPDHYCTLPETVKREMYFNI